MTNISVGYESALVAVDKPDLLSAPRCRPQFVGHGRNPVLSYHSTLGNQVVLSLA